MHGQERRAERGNALDAACHRIADVVQLEIDEHLLAAVGEAAHQRQAAGIGELITDLVKCHAVAEPGYHRFGGGDAGQIERHDQAVAGGDSGRRHIPSHHALGDFDQLPHQRLQRLDIGRMFQPVHVVIGLAGK